MAVETAVKYGGIKIDPRCLLPYGLITNIAILTVCDSFYRKKQ